MAERIDTVSRVIAAAPETVFAPFVDPDLLIRWLPPEGMTGEILAFDPREDGAYRIALHYRDPSFAPGKSDVGSDVSSGRFVRIEPRRLIVQSVTFQSDDPAFAGEMEMSWEFEPSGDGTRVTVRARHVPPGIEADDHRAGMAASLSNLAVLLERKR